MAQAGHARDAATVPALAQHHDELRKMGFMMARIVAHNEAVYGAHYTLFVTQANSSSS